jgi:hypothetical protein
MWGGGFFFSCFSGKNRGRGRVGWRQDVLYRKEEKKKRR